MRLAWILAVLVIANALAFAWVHGDLDALSGNAPAPERMRRQVDADRLQVQAPTAGAAADGKSPSRAAAPETCIELGPLDEPRAARLRALAEEFAPKVRIEQQSDDTGAGVWMVYSSPADSLAGAQRRLADFRRQGIQDLYLMQDGPWRWGISFGLFRSEDGARGLLESLARQNVTGLKVAQRAASDSRALLRLRWDAEPWPGNDWAPRLAAALAELGLSPTVCNGRTGGR